MWRRYHPEVTIASGTPPKDSRGAPDREAGDAGACARGSSLFLVDVERIEHDALHGGSGWLVVAADDFDRQRVRTRSKPARDEHRLLVLFLERRARIHHADELPVDRHACEARRESALTQPPDR